MAAKVEAIRIFFTVYRILAKINADRLSFNVRNFSVLFCFVYVCIRCIYAQGVMSNVF